MAMKRSKFTEAQIAFILQQAEEGTAVGEVCRKAGISESTFYYWRKKYAGLMPSEMKRLRQLEEENGKLKKLVADLSLDRAMLQDVIRRNVWSAPSLQGPWRTLQEPPHWAGALLPPNEGDCSNARAHGTGGFMCCAPRGVAATARIRTRRVYRELGLQ